MPSGLRLSSACRGQPGARRIIRRWRQPTPPLQALGAGSEKRKRRTLPVGKDLEVKEVTPSERSDSSPSLSCQAAVERVWAEVLKRQDIKTHENFFDLGGDSLKALEVISRLQALLEIELPLMVFFEGPTIAHLAQVADELRPKPEPLAETPARDQALLK